MKQLRISLYDTFLEIASSTWFFSVTVYMYLRNFGEVEIRELKLRSRFKECGFEDTFSLVRFRCVIKML